MIIMAADSLARKCASLFLLIVIIDLICFIGDTYPVSAAHLHQEQSRFFCVMYALVRYLDDKKACYYTVPVTHIENFNPSNTSDFVKNKVYSAYWVDSADPDSTGYYEAQIYMLGETEDDIRRNREKRRMPKPRLDRDAAIETHPPKQNERQGTRRNRTEAQNSAWQDIIRRHVSHNLEKNASVHTAASRIRREPESDRESSSDDEELVSSEEVKKAEGEASFWRHRYDLECEMTKSLRSQVDKLQECLRAKLFSLEPTLDKLVSLLESKPEGLPSTDDVLPVVDQPSKLSAHSTVPPHELPFAEVANKVHLTSGYEVSTAQAVKIFGNKKPTIVVKDTAEALWGLDGLALRTPSGKSTEGGKKQLTPEKVEVVRSTLHEWGKRKGIDVETIGQQLNAILSSKCQDAARKRKKCDTDEQDKNCSDI